MADVKISGLPASSLPLAGTEVLPIVQGTTTKKVATDDLTVKNIRSNATNGILQIVGPAAAATRVMTTPDANFTAARIDAAQSFTGNQTLSTGNLVIGTAGKGIDFTQDPNPAGMTSELLDDYEEGTWTPTVTPQTGSLTAYTSNGYYTKIGNIVTVQAQFVITTPGTAAGIASIGDMPFASGGYTGSAGTGTVLEYWNTGNWYFITKTSSSTISAIRGAANGPLGWGSGDRYAFTLTYMV